MLRSEEEGVGRVKGSESEDRRDESEKSESVRLDLPRERLGTITCENQE